MAPKKKTRVFVSYSRHDEALVRPLAGLLGIATDRAVFLDVTSLHPGDEWETEIVKAIREASVFVLCWCCKCQKSEFVAKEIRTALVDTSKRLVPVLFCSADLPKALARKQWIDLRGRILHDCGEAHRPAAGPEAPASPAPSAAKVISGKKPDGSKTRLEEPSSQGDDVALSFRQLTDFGPNENSEDPAAGKFALQDLKEALTDEVSVQRLRRVWTARAEHADRITDRVRAYFETLDKTRT